MVAWITFAIRLESLASEFAPGPEQENLWPEPEIGSIYYILRAARHTSGTYEDVDVYQNVQHRIRQVGRVQRWVRGWPWRCVEGMERCEINGRHQVCTPYGLTRYSGKVVVYSPLWRGLILDCALGAAAWLVLLSVASACRALLRSAVSNRRRKLSRCIACGYDLRTISGDVCPECGTSTVSA